LIIVTTFFTLIVARVDDVVGFFLCRQGSGSREQAVVLTACVLEERRFYASHYFSLASSDGEASNFWGKQPL
jgi:hypothetical protein